MLSKSARPPTLRIKALAARFHKQCVRSRQDLQHSASKYSRHSSTNNAFEVGNTTNTQDRTPRGTPPQTMRSKSARPPTLSIEILAARLHKQCIPSQQGLQHSATVSRHPRHTSTGDVHKVGKTSDAQHRGIHGTSLPAMPTAARRERGGTRARHDHGKKEKDTTVR